MVIEVGLAHLISVCGTVSGIVLGGFVWLTKRSMKHAEDIRALDTSMEIFREWLERVEKKLDRVIEDKRGV